MDNRSPDEGSWSSAIASFPRFGIARNQITLGVRRHHLVFDEVAHVFEVGGLAFVEELKWLDLGCSSRWVSDPNIKDLHVELVCISSEFHYISYPSFQRADSYRGELVVCLYCC